MTAGRWYKAALLVAVPLIIVGVRWATYNTKRQSASYTVTLRGGQTSGFTVHGSFSTNENVDTLKLTMYLQREVSGIHLSSVRDDNGTIPYDSTLVPTQYQATTFHFCRYAIPVRETDRVKVDYSGRIGLLEGFPHTVGFTGQCYGDATPDWAVFSLAQILVGPAGTDVTKTVKVSYRVPNNWLPVKNYGRVGRHGDLRELHASALVAGEYREYRDGKFEVMIVGAAAVAESDSLFACCRRVYRRSRAFWARDLASPYRIILAPPRGNGFEAFVSPTRYACVSTYSRGRLVHPLTVVLNVMQRFREDVGIDGRITANRDQWFVSGVVAFYSEKFCEEIFPGSFDSNDPQIVDRYAATIEGGDFALGSGAVSLGGADPSQRFHKAAAVVDQLVARSRQGNKNFDDVIHELLRSKTIPDLRSALETISGGNLHSFFDSYVYGTRPLPYEAVAVAPKPVPIRDEVDSLQLIVTYDGLSYLENCGCKVNQSGGVARRTTVIRDFTRRFIGPSFAIDLGNSFPDDKTMLDLDEERHQELMLFLKTMKETPYDCAVVSETELLHGVDLLLSAREQVGVPFVSANVTRNGLPLVPPTVDCVKNGVSVRFVGVTAKKHVILDRIWRVHTAGLDFVPVRRAVRTAIKNGSNGRNLVVVAGGIRPSVAREIATECADVGVIVSYRNECWCADGDTLRSADTSGMIGHTLVLYPWMSTYGVTRYVIYRDQIGRIVGFNSQQLLLDDSVVDDAHVRAQIDSFYSDVRRRDTDDRPSVGMWETELLNGRRFVGASACADCHPEQTQQWFTTRHSSAYKTLLRVHRQYRRSCVVCHVTGGGQPTGFDYDREDATLRDVQCEVCHGPGSAHSATAKVEAIRRNPDFESCVRCHDEHHSDMTQGNFATYYAKVAH